MTVVTDAPPLLERERELERITGLLGRTRDGRGGALILEGPAGIGKTALIAAARAAARGAGFRVLRARGAALERDFAYGVVRQLVEPLLAEASEDTRASLLEGPARTTTSLLDLAGHHATRTGLAALRGDPTCEVLHGLYRLCMNCAAERALLVVVDDAHWADAASLSFLTFLLPRLEGRRVAVLIAVRPAEAAERRELLTSLMVDHATELVRVRPLTLSGVAGMVTAGLGTESESAFAAACSEATGGTPLLVRVLVDALREARIDPSSASAEKVGDLVTGGLSRWAVLQLARLGPDAVRLAGAVAILGSCRLAQAALLAQLSPADAARTAAVLVGSHVLAEHPLRFVHPLLRGAVYRGIAAADRADAHRRAARLVAEERDPMTTAAEHLMLAGPAGDRWAVEQLRSAAREAAARGAHGTACRRLRRALAEPPPPETRAHVLQELGVAELRCGEPGWEHDLRSSLTAACDDATRAGTALVLAEALRGHQRLADAVAVCDGAAAALEGADPDALLTLEAMAIACGMLDMVSAPSVAGRAAALLARAREGVVPPQMLAVSAWVAALRNEPAESVARLARRAIDAAPDALCNPAERPWFPIALLALCLAERHADAQALCDAGARAARTSTDVLMMPAVATYCAGLAFWRGELATAEADARSVVDAPMSLAPLLFRVLATGVLVGALVERGALDEAEAQLERMACNLHSTSQTAGVLRHARGRLRLAQQRVGEALDDFETAGEIARRTGAVSPCFLSWRADAALAHLALGRAGRAGDLSEEELQLARAFGAPRALGVALRAAGLAAGGDRGERLLREAVEVLAAADARLEWARALTDLGGLLRLTERRGAARPVLMTAIDAARRVGAVALAERAETELRAMGVRRRRAPLCGDAPLAAYERRIA